MPTQFFITGFGEFHGVSRNPTQQIAEWLQSKMRNAATDGHQLSSTPGDAPSPCPFPSSETSAQEISTPEGAAGVFGAGMPIVAAASTVLTPADQQHTSSPQQQQQQQQQYGPQIRDVTVLRVSAEAVDAYVQDCLSKVECCAVEGCPVVLLHFGVDTTVSV